MPVRVVTLVENSGGEHLALLHEHGLSFYVEKDGRKLLFDLGQSDAFLKNAGKLNIDLSDVEFVVASHGHYDHSGGLRSLVGVAKRFTFAAGRGFFDGKYATDGFAYEFLGNDFDEGFLDGNGIPRRTIGVGKEEILPGVFVLSGFPRVHADEVVNPRFRLLRNGKFEADAFEDEVLLAIDAGKGMVVLLGCSHPGLKNMLDAVKASFPKPILAILGGTHLVEASAGSLERSLAYLDALSAGVLGLSHCTGKTAVDRIAASPLRQFRNGTGRMLAFD